MGFDYSGALAFNFVEWASRETLDLVELRRVLNVPAGKSKELLHSLATFISINGDLLEFGNLERLKNACHILTEQSKEELKSVKGVAKKRLQKEITKASKALENSIVELEKKKFFDLTDKLDEQKAETYARILAAISPQLTVKEKARVITQLENSPVLKSMLRRDSKDKIEAIRSLGKQLTNRLYHS